MPQRELVLEGVACLLTDVVGINTVLVGPLQVSNQLPPACGSPIAAATFTQPPHRPRRARPPLPLAIWSPFVHAKYCIL